MGAPKKVTPYHTFPLLGFKGRLASLFALAKFVIDEQFLRKILLITYQKKCSNCYTMFYSNFLFACLFLSSNH